MSQNTLNFRLFKKRASFNDGVCFLFDMSPNNSRYNYDTNETMIDINSLRADWYAIGEDLNKSIKIYESSKKS